MEDYLKKFTPTSPRPERKDELLTKAAQMLQEERGLPAERGGWWQRHRLGLALAASLILVIGINFVVEHRIEVRHEQLVRSSYQPALHPGAYAQRTAPLLQSANLEEALEDYRLNGGSLFAMLPDWGGPTLEEQEREILRLLTK